MGTRTSNRSPQAWQGSLVQMKTYGTRVAQHCIAGDCRRWIVHDLEELIAEYGPDHMLWNRRPPCAVCGGPTHFMASPGPSTPFRPLLSGLLADEAKRQFLKGFGFSKRDVLRIQRLAEATTRDESPPPPLADLDVPFRIGSCWPGREGYFTGRILGEYAGRTLLYWEMNQAEAEVWARRRRVGPKPVPSPRRP